MNLAEQVKEKILEVENILNNNQPGLPNLLKTIHTILKKDPEVVTLLSEEECNVIVEGLKEHTKVEIAAKAMKSTPRKALKQTTLEDL